MTTETFDHKNDNHPTDSGNSIPSNTVPPLPSRYRHSLFSNFGDEFAALDEEAPLLHTVLEALLKRPGRIAYEICHGRGGKVLATLLLIALMCTICYGVLMGTFSGGHQLWMTPLRAILVVCLSALVCLPSLYILTALAGATQSLREISALLCQSLALAALLMAGFAPVVWVFSQSTGTVGFMAFMHLAFWTVGTIFGTRLLGASLSYLNARSIRTLGLWTTIFVIVMLQMCTTFRPLIGEYQGVQLQEKKFFLTHWGDTLAGRNRCGR